MTKIRQVCVLLVATSLLVTLAVAPGAGAQQEPLVTTATTGVQDVDIIPRPNTGVAPEEPGDRGGWMQTGLFALIVVALASGAVYIAVQSRRTRQRRGY